MKRKGEEHWNLAIGAIIAIIAAIMLAAVILGWVENAQEFILRRVTE